MSSPGYFNTEDQQAMMDLQRKQAFAQALMRQGGEDPGNQAYGGLRNAGNSILGAFLTGKYADKEKTLSGEIANKKAKSLAAILNPQEEIAPVTSTPQITAPGQLEERQAAGAYSQPLMRTPNTAEALAKTGDSELMAQFAPMLIQDRLTHDRESQTYTRARGDALSDYTRTRGDTLHDKAMTPVPEAEVHAMGLRGKYQRDAFGGLHQVEKDDALSPEALEQKLRLAREGRSPGANGEGLFSMIDTANGMYGVTRGGQAKPMTGPDGKPLVSYHSDVPLRYDMGAAQAGGRAGGTVAESLPTTEAAFKQINDSLDAFNRPEVKAQAANSLGMVDSRLPTIPGYNSNFVNRLKQTQGQTFLQAFNALRGAGQITEVEGDKATNALTRLNQASTEKDFYEALSDARRVFSEVQNSVRQRASRGAVVPRMGAGQPGPQPSLNGGLSPSEQDELNRLRQRFGR